MIILLLLLIVIIVYSLNHSISFGETLSRVGSFIFTVVAYTFLAALIFAVCYLILEKIGLIEGNEKISIVIAMAGALYFYHKTEDL